MKSDIYKKVSVFEIKDESQKKDKNDCHKFPFLDKWLGRRAIITTTKGIVKGRLEYLGGRYFCRAPFRLKGDEWEQSYYRFVFRKSEFRSIEMADIETSKGY